MDRFAGESLQIDTPYDRSTIDKLYQLINTHRPLFAKLRLEFLTDISSLTELMRQQRLTDIHAGMVDLQKKHTGITDILTKNTQGGWENIHEHIHRLESQIRGNSMTFMRTVGLNHDNTDTAPGWLWDNRFTAQEWADSTSFSTSDISMPTSELGRTPYEAFQFAPDNWRSEGSISGTIAPRVELQTGRRQHRLQHQQPIDTNHGVGQDALRSFPFRTRQPAVRGQYQWHPGTQGSTQHQQITKKTGSGIRGMV